METTTKLKERIIAITKQMNKYYPELSASINQSSSGFLNIKRNSNFVDLKKYHDSLIQILKKYIP